MGLRRWSARAPRSVDAEASCQRGLDADLSLKATDVVASLDQLKTSRATRKRIYCDNGSEFLSGQMDFWASANGVKFVVLDDSAAAIGRTWLQRFCNC
jgi:hypothetical protein